MCVCVCVVCVCVCVRVVGVRVYVCVFCVRVFRGCCSCGLSVSGFVFWGCVGVCEGLCEYCL